MASALQAKKKKEIRRRTSLPFRMQFQFSSRSDLSPLLSHEMIIITRSLLIYGPAFRGFTKFSDSQIGQQFLHLTFYLYYF